MIAKINKGTEQFQEFFHTNFTQCDQESVDWGEPLESDKEIGYGIFDKELKF